MRRALVCLLMVAVPVGGAVLPAGTAGAAAAHAGYSGPCHAAVDRYWPARLQPWAHYVVNRESRGQQGVMNRRAVGRYGRASGCFQMLPGYAAPFLRSARCSSLLVADCNVRAAWALYVKAGTSPWRVR